MKTIGKVLLPVLVLILILSLPHAVMAGSVLPYFSGSDLVDVNGNAFNESVMTSRLNLVTVWTTTCGWCEYQLPFLAAANRDYAGELNIIAVQMDAINADGSLNQATIEEGKRLFSENGAAFKNLIPNDGLRNFLNQQNVDTVPRSWFISSNGVIVHVVEGSMGSEYLKYHINRLLKADLSDITTTPLLTVSLDKADVEVGQLITASWAMESLKPPIFVNCCHLNITESNGEIQMVAPVERLYDLASAVFEPLFGVSGEFYLTVTDVRGLQMTSTSRRFTITGAQALDPLKAEITLDRKSVAVGQPITASWNISGGKAPYEVTQVSWLITEANGREEGFFDHPAIGITSCTWTPQIGASGYVLLSVTDADKRSGDFKSSTFEITGAEAVDSLRAAINLDKSSVQVGEPITASWTITGGRPPYEIQVDWWIKEANGSITGVNDHDAVSSSILTPNFGSNGSFRLYIVDADERTLWTDWSEFAITGAASAEPLNAEISLNKATVKLGEPIIVSWTITGGKPPYEVSTSWYIMQKYATTEYPSGTASDNTNTLIPMNGENGQFNVYVIDADGRRDGFWSPTFTITDTPSEGEPLIGDATNDGTVDILDLVSIIDYIVSNTSPASLANADANGDGMVDILDLVWIIDMIVGE